MNANVKYKAHCIVCQGMDRLHLVVHYNDQGNMVGLVFCCDKHIESLSDTVLHVVTAQGVKNHTFMNRSPYETSTN